MCSSRENKSFAVPAFQVMGLGDMNYSRFNNMGQLTDLNLDAWIAVCGFCFNLSKPHTLHRNHVCMLQFADAHSEERLGATRIFKRGIGDDSCLIGDWKCKYSGFQTKVHSSCSIILVLSFLFRTGKSSLEVKIL